MQWPNKQLALLFSVFVPVFGACYSIRVANYSRCRIKRMLYKSLIHDRAVPSMPLTVQSTGCDTIMKEQIYCFYIDLVCRTKLQKKSMTLCNKTQDPLLWGKESHPRENIYLLCLKLCILGYTIFGCLLNISVNGSPT